MLWVVDDHEIHVLVGEEEKVGIVRWEEQKKIVQVPVRMSRAEAIWTIRNLLQEQHNGMPQDVAPAAKLEVFGTYWPIREISSRRTPYIQQGIVYCSISKGRFSASQQAKIKEELLKVLVVRHIGDWEERLGILIPDIAFRKNSGRPYTVQRHTGALSFDRELHRLSLHTIAYCVWKAVAEYSGLGQDEQNRYIRKYFPVWKTEEKILGYEYTTYHDN